MRQTLRKAARLIGPGQRRRWLLLVLLALIVSAFEMIGAALVYVLLSVAADPSAPIELPILGDVRGSFQDFDDRALLMGLVVLLGAFFLVRAGVRIGAAYAQSRVANNAGARLSNRLVTGYLTAPYVFHLQRSSAELIRNSHQAVTELVSQVFLPVINITAESLLVAGMLVVMFAIAPEASVLAVGVVGGSSLVLLRIVQPRLKALGRIAHRTSRDTLSILQQGLHGIRDVKLLAKERWFSRSYARSRLELARTMYLRGALTELPRNVIELSLIGFILIFFGVTTIAGGGGPTTLSVLGLFAYVGLRLQPSIQKILAGLNNLKFASAPMDDLYSDLLAIEDADAHSVVQPLPFNEVVVLDGVGFRYEGVNEAALRNINLTIHRGEQIGVCGPTGGGKTTLVDIISGLLEPTVGQISIDDKDLRDVTREWQRGLGVVSQTVFLIDDTLKRNIALGIPDEEIDDQALTDAISLAQIGDFVESLPSGWDTLVGERGIRISGGQRQRIAIARALYRRPRVLIFDEGTSALDNTTEATLMNAVAGISDNPTVILVAHRLSTLRTSSRILVVEAGTITGEGTYDELMRSHESFRLMALTGDGDSYEQLSKRRSS